MSKQKLTIRQKLHCATLLLLAGMMLLPMAEWLPKENKYASISGLDKLVAKSSEAQMKRLERDQQNFAWKLKEETSSNPSISVNPAAAVGVRLPDDLGQGVEVSDTENKVGFKLAPEFETLPGRLEQERFVYPTLGPGQLIYTLKGNGLKEDIVLPSFAGSSTSYSFKLELPNSLEARLQEDGSLGIYGPDTVLLGNISTSTDEDRDRLELAKNKSQKTELVFSIPAPIVKDAEGREHTDKARFEYSNNKLTLIASELDKLTYPISLDPSIVVTSANEFGAGVDEGNIDFDSANGRITRGSVTGGTVDSWNTTTGLPADRAQLTAVAYNGYIYVMGGYDGGSTYFNSVVYAPINSNGTLGSWNTTSSFTTARSFHSSVAYNGYVYVIGGSADQGSTTMSDVQYAKINSNGTLGTWSTTTSLASPGRAIHSSAVLNGYLYVSGGYDGTNDLDSVVYAKINGNGTIGSWASAGTDFTTEREAHVMLANSNYLYIIGGFGGSELSDVQYAKANNDGTLGSWTATTSLLDDKSGQAAVAYKGYIYITGQVAGAETEYAPILADGKIGDWSSAPDLSGSTWQHGMIAYNGYLYILNTALNTPYAQITSAGEISNFKTNSTSFTTARTGHGTLVYRGRIYVIGGCSTSGCDGIAGSYLTSIYYAAINDDGSIGSWSTTTNQLPAGRAYMGVIGYGDRIYTLGGSTNAGLGQVYTSTVQSATISPAGDINSTFTNTVGIVSQTPLDSARSHMAVAMHNNMIYVSGGYNGSTVYANADYAAIDDTGIVGSWTSSGSTGTARYMAALAVYGKYAYLTGGYTSGGAASSEVNRASINGDGTLGSWSTSGQAQLSTARYAHGMVALNGKLYIMDGRTTSTVSSVLIGSLDSGGNISGWATAASSNSTARFQAGAVTAQGKIYIVGGCTTNSHTCSNYSAATEHAFVNNAGSGASTATWSSTTGFTTARRGHLSVAYKDNIYILGGCTAIDGNGTCTNYLSDTQYAKIGSDGSVGSWTSQTSLPTSLWRASATEENGYIYVSGGVKGDGSFSSDVIYARINSDGTLSSNSCGTAVTWCSATSLADSRYIHASTSYNGYVYISGGLSAGGSNKSYYGQIGANGNISSWSTGQNLPEDRVWVRMTSYNGYLYLVGGCTTGACTGTTNYRSTVLISKLNGNGSMDAWTYGSAMPVNLRLVVPVATNGYLFAYGGQNDDQVNAAPFYAPINSDGTLGKWSQSTNDTGINAFDHTAVAVNGFLYSLGGNVGGSISNSVRYGAPKTINRYASYSKSFETDNDVDPTKIVVNGTAAGLNSKYTVEYRTGPNSGAVYGAVTTNTYFSLATPTAIEAIDGSSANVGLGRYYWLRFTIDDNESATFLSDTLSTITDYTLYYHPSTLKRLKGGKTFTNEIQRGLDASP